VQITLQPVGLDGLVQSFLEQALARSAQETASPAERDAFVTLAVACRSLGWRDVAHSAMAAAEQCGADALADLTLPEAEAWYFLGEALNALGQRSLAIAALENAVAVQPDHAQALMTLGLACIEENRIDDAVTYLKRVLSLDPNNAKAHAYLSSSLYREGHLEQAQAHARAALDIDPGAVIAHRTLGGLLVGLGRLDEGRYHLRKGFADHNLIVARCPDAKQTVLVLTTATDGNVPDTYLLPADRYTRLFWFVEYADPSQFDSLPPYDVVFNAIGDPDRLGDALDIILEFQRSSSRRMLNDPGPIVQTARHLTPGLLGDIAGVVVPATVRIGGWDSAQGLLEAARQAGIPAPLLARPLGSHGGDGLTLIRQDEATPAIAPSEHYLTAFHDFKSADGLYRKYRVIFVDRTPFPYHLGISGDWMVHYETCDMPAHPDRIAEEMRFLEAPETALGAQAMTAIAAIGARIDLDFCGLDFSLLPDGRVLVFEANATMLVHPEPQDGPLAHKNPYVERILRAFQNLLVAPG
jgi:tetratricopeptide (TPR) repeat protein